MTRPEAPQLPVEILYEVFMHIRNDPLSSIYDVLKVYKNCRLVCSTFDDLVTPLLYLNIPIRGPHTFARFLDELRFNPHRGLWVRTLDFSTFTSVGLGRSRSSSDKILMLTASTLTECFRLCPNVQELFLSEALESDIDVHVLHSIFDLRSLKALDLCASDSSEFVRSLMLYKTQEQYLVPRQSSVRNLSLHNCSTIPIDFFPTFFGRFTNMTRLDLCNTLVTGHSLLSLPTSSRLISLNLSQCTNLTASDLMAFVLGHPACSSLQELKLLYSWNKTHPLSNVPQQLDLFISSLPRQLTVLDLAGIELDLAHLSSMPKGLLELGAHDIDVGAISLVEQAEGDSMIHPALQDLQYLLLTHNVISEVSKFARILTSLFPKLAVIESPGFSKLHLLSSAVWERYEGAGRRDWLRRRAVNSDRITQHMMQFHPRKCNMSLTQGCPRGLYAYYSYRV